jgi:ATP-binding cassette subfamily B protein
MTTAVTSAAAADHDTSLDHLPDEVKTMLRAHVPLEQVLAVAPQDLDRQGRYMHGYVVLAPGRIGQYIQGDGKWDCRWIGTDQFASAVIVEGLGMGLLRLVKDDKALTEYRYSLRHARSMARLHRQLERQIKADVAEEAKPEPRRPDDKKIRCDQCDRVIPPWAESCPACLSKRKILFRLMDFIGPYKGRAITGAVLAICMTLLGLIQPLLSKPMMDHGLGTAGGTPNWDLFVTYVLLLMGLVLVLNIGHGVQSRLMAGLGSRIARNVRDTVYRHLHKLSLSYFSKRPTGSLVTRVTSDSDRLWDFVAFTVIESTTSILMIAGVAVMMFALHWKLALFTLLPVPLMIVLMVFFHVRLHNFFGRIWHRWSQMTSVIADALPGVRVIKAFSQEGREINRFEHKNHQLFDEEMNMVNTWTTFGPVMAFCTQIGNIIVWLLGGWWTIQNYHYMHAHNGVAMPGGMTVGTLVAFMGLMAMFYRPIHTIAHMDRQFNRAATSAQRIFEVLDTEPTIFSKSGAAPVSELRGEIELRNVSFSYDGVRRVLKNVDLKISPGEMIGLAGPSGGGKTTLVNLVCRFYHVLEGQILIDGVDVRDYEVHDLRRRIGVVLQEPFLFHGTIAENIAYGRPEATMEAIIRSAKAANAHDFIVGFPDGYDTMVGERGQSLSGGERQRISIARAILNDPTILILDEATSSVDTETEKLIQEALDRLVANRTTIAIAHRLSTLRKADRLVVLENGSVKEQGSHDELARKEDGLYAKLLHMQTELQSTMAI